jgi:hypothetical protein
VAKVGPQSLVTAAAAAVDQTQVVVEDPQSPEKGTPALAAAAAARVVEVLVLLLRSCYQWCQEGSCNGLLSSCQGRM